ncbi:unnamed protein product [Penicillium pancosmium]
MGGESSKQQGGVIGGSTPSRLPHLGSQARAQTLGEPAAAPPPETNPFKPIPATIEFDTQGHRHQRHSSTPSLIIFRQDGKLSPCYRIALILPPIRLDMNHAPWPTPGVENTQPIVLAIDLLNPTPQAEARKHKLKTLVPQPRSFFMDVKCPGCFTITTVFSHAQTVVICAGCSTVLCQPTGGKARLTEGCSFRRK